MGNGNDIPFYGFDFRLYLKIDFEENILFLLFIRR